jgi:NAD(P)-dependent dehydrogenase (short-subunit alcohol dehydrogenase family)
MRALCRTSGSIINIWSTYGHLGARGASVCSASKHGVEGLTKSAALEAAGSGVRINRTGTDRNRDAQPLHR